MRQYQLKETKEREKIICNKCGREIPAPGGCARKGVFSVDYTWDIFRTRMENVTVLIFANPAMMSCSEPSAYSAEIEE